jgi:hypothetical protein
MSVVPLAGVLGASLGPTFASREKTRATAELRFTASFVEVGHVASIAAEAEAQGLLPVFVQPLRPADRGNLALVIEEAVEGALERRGACPPGVGASTDLDTSLGDQLYRARLVEARGLCVYVGNMEGATALSGALDAEDSAVLRFWLEAPRTRAVRFLLDATNRSIGVYGPPLALGAVVAALDAAPSPTELHDEASPRVSPEIAASAETMEHSAPPPAVASNEPMVVHELHVEAHVVVTETHGDARGDAHGDETDGGEHPADATHGDARDVAQTETHGDARAEADATHAAETETQSAETESRGADTETHAAAPHGDDDSTLDATTDEPLVAGSIAHAILEGLTTARPPEVAHAQPTEVAPKPAPEPSHGPLHPGASTEWQNWARELDTARGPKPLAAVERMFVMSYVPLRDAVMRGLAPESAMSSLEGWARSFAGSYREAFEAMRVRGKRPTMVLDVPEAALRIGRLHGARSVQLLLVDGLRFDLGLRVELGLRARLGREAALTERLLLWSALPSTTEMQLELIGRGPEGLKELTAAPESEVPVARGRMAKTPRRVKTGHRELLKLDLVEARLSEPGPPEAARLDALGAEVTEAVAELCEKLPPRTLLFVFGDHGFRLEPQGDGTGALRQGGPRPEEVLVPAFAWLIGGVQ